MCQTSVVIKSGSDEVEILKDVISVEPDDNGVSVKGFFGEHKRLSARIIKIDMIARKIILEPLP